jgi:hypothetical protein
MMKKSLLSLILLQIVLKLSSYLITSILVELMVTILSDPKGGGVSKGGARTYPCDIIGRSRHGGFLATQGRTLTYLGTGT